jgi:hypothetical protein
MEKSGSCLLAMNPYGVKIPQPEKLAKLIGKMQLLVNVLGERTELVVHQRVDQFFYMQKIEELKILGAQLEDMRRNLEHLTSRVQVSYMTCLAEWKRDARWLNAYLMRRREQGQCASDLGIRSSGTG